MKNARLFKRWYSRKDRKYFYWWFYYKDFTGKRIYKPAGWACTLKREAQAFVDALPDPQGAAPAGILREVAGGMFLPGCSYLERQAERGRVLSQHTIRIQRAYIENYILPAFRDRQIAELTAAEIEDWLVGLDLSGSVKNAILGTWRTIFREAQRQRLIQGIPQIERFRRQSRRYDTLQDEELAMLFPEDPAALETIWRDEVPWEPEHAGLMFGAMFCLMVSAGLRSGEARAIHRDQIFPELCGIVINRAYNLQDQLTAPKKGTERDPRFRAVVVPARTMRVLSWWLEKATQAGPIFVYYDRPVRREYLLDRFRLGLRQAGIQTEGRRLMVHSLRYTYNTRMETLLPGGLLRQFMGHRNEEMTALYSRPHMLDRIRAYQTEREKVERFWE